MLPREDLETWKLVDQDSERLERQPPPTLRVLVELGCSTKIFDECSSAAGLVGVTLEKKKKDFPQEEEECTTCLKA